MDYSLRNSAEEYLQLARQSVRAHTPLCARMAYMISIESFRKAAACYPSLTVRLHAVQREYDAFMRHDVLYTAILRELEETVRRQPGILRDALCDRLHHYPQKEVRLALYFAVKEGKLVSAETDHGTTITLPLTPSRLSFSSHLRKMFFSVGKN